MQMGPAASLAASHRLHPLNVHLYFVQLLPPLTDFLANVLLAQWIRRLSTEQETPGSNPGQDYRVHLGRESNDDCSVGPMDTALVFGTRDSGFESRAELQCNPVSSVGRAQDF